MPQATLFVKRPKRGDLSVKIHFLKKPFRAPGEAVVSSLHGLGK
jgi:hypothetical protein